jgi:predicted SnoaL-like aldol condensation-catalyzing enzyme
MHRPPHPRQQNRDIDGLEAQAQFATLELGRDRWRVEDGMLAEHWDVVDWAGLIAQLRA